MNDVKITLKDECLSPDLVSIAQTQGYQATHVIWLGLDWTIVPRAVEDGSHHSPNCSSIFRTRASSGPSASTCRAFSTFPAPR